MRNRKKTKRQMWQIISDQVNLEFGCKILPNQVENKWSALEKKYRTVKQHNNISGNDKRTCEFEEQLAEVLERQHLINPVYVAGAGCRRVQSAQSAAPSPRTYSKPAAQHRHGH